MSLIRHLNPLEYKAIGILEFKIKTPLHVGTGGIEARRTLVRISGDRILIPSSTWKGSFRSISEKIAKSMKFEDKLAELAVRSFEEGQRVTYNVDRDFCEEILNVLKGGKSDIIPYNKDSLIKVASEIGFTSEELIEIEEKGFAARDDLLNRLAGSILAIHCPIGKLYGNHLLAGKLRFLDTILRVGVDRIVHHERPGIAIDRRSGRAKEHALFILESILGEGVKLRVIADNLIPGAEDSKLFSLTLKAIGNFGLSIGARKSAGMGLVELDKKSSSWYIVSLKDDKDGMKIANPLKYGEKKNFDEFLKWLLG